jgi:hypothetical protein
LGATSLRKYLARDVRSLLCPSLVKERKSGTRLASRLVWQARVSVVNGKIMVPP